MQQVFLENDIDSKVKFNINVCEHLINLESISADPFTEQQVQQIINILKGETK